MKLFSTVDLYLTEFVEGQTVRIIGIHIVDIRHCLLFFVQMTGVHVRINKYNDQRFS